MQGGSQGSSQAIAGDKINSSPISFGGGVIVGDISTGSTTQNPQSDISGSTSQGGFDFKIPSMGGGEQPQE